MRSASIDEALQARQRLAQRLTEPEIEARTAVRAKRATAEVYTEEVEPKRRIRYGRDILTYSLTVAGGFMTYAALELLSRAF